MSSIFSFQERFLNIESAITACRSITIENDYGLRLSTKKTNRQGVITSRQLLYDRAEFHDSQSKGIGKCGTIKSNCKFSLWIRLSGDEYIIDVNSPSHNHPPFMSTTGHSCVTTLKEYEKKSITCKSELGIPPRTILAELRHDDSRATAKGIYNCLATHRKLQLRGQIPTHVLLRLLRGEKDDDFKEEHQEWWFDYSIDTESCLTHLFSCITP